jgi:hypothetical protein
MLNVSTRCLKIVAGLIWFAGAFVLVVKGGSLLAEAFTLRSERHWPWLAVVTGLALGFLQAKLVFINSCRKNLDRISTLEQPKLWQFFTTRFFVMLLVMILVGATLSRLAHRNYPFLLGVAVLDLSISTALLSSSYVFWKHGNSFDVHAA